MSYCASKCNLVYDVRLETRTAKLGATSSPTAQNAGQKSNIPSTLLLTLYNGPDERILKNE